MSQRKAPGNLGRSQTWRQRGMDDSLSLNPSVNPPPRGERGTDSTVEISNSSDPAQSPISHAQRVSRPTLSEDPTLSAKSDDSTPADTISVFVIREIRCDLLAAPDGAVLIHATNCLGEWGAGIAALLKSVFPAAFAEYRDHCARALNPHDLAGTCFLIPPQECGPAATRAQGRWIACLFTSVGYGRPNRKTGKQGKSGKDAILRHTRVALRSLRVQLETCRQDASDEEGPGELWACRFNSGSFGVPWASGTRVVMEEEFAGSGREVTVAYQD